MYFSRCLQLKDTVQCTRLLTKMANFKLHVHVLLVIKAFLSMYMHVHVCVCTCVCMYMCVHVHVCTCTCVYTPQNSISDSAPHMQE